MPALLHFKVRVWMKIFLKYTAVSCLLKQSKESTRNTFFFDPGISNRAVNPRAGGFGVIIVVVFKFVLFIIYILVPADKNSKYSKITQSRPGKAL